MTIKWVKSDPLVMNGEPFCYGSRLTVRNLLEMRAHGLSWRDIQVQNPELKKVGIAEAYRFAGEHRDRYIDFFGPDGSLEGPGFDPRDAADLPEYLRTMTGVVVSPAAGTATR
jgi:uncharacterized protein (DUF433 family)